MTNQSANAREAMVVSQLQPNGVSSEKVLAAYRAVERENGLPDAIKSVCYLDESFDLGNGAIMLEPMLHGIMVERLDVRACDQCLVINDQTGYTASILSHLGAHVTAHAEEGYDIIFINGAVCEIPDALVSRLRTGGRIAAILQPDPRGVGKITIATRESSGALACRQYNDAKTAYVAEYAPKPEFVF